MMVTTIGQYLLVLMACCAQVIICSSDGNNSDMLFLLEFKKTISDPQQALMSWNDSTPFCDWEGVLCRRNIPRRVTSLDIGNRGLAGHISPSLGNLTFLRHLFLATNIFSGQIPPSLGQLHRLETLYLSNNTLQGIIPSFANSSNLKVLWLDRNNLVGQFPDLPPGLVELQVSGNNLVGTVPASLANITTLERFSCAFNDLEGNIPTDFARLPELQRMYAGSNKLTGRFPQAILNLSTLIGLSLNTNLLRGKVPSDIGTSLPNLQLFSIAGNFFQGRIPSSLINMSGLYDVRLSNNSFTGVVPRSIGTLSKLSQLNVEMNQLKAQDWEFLNSLANCTELQILSLAGNQLEGPVPDSLGNLSIQLEMLYLGGNKLSGRFPSGIANLRSLIILGLDYNQFSGVVPEFVGTLRTLQGLSLSNNTFTGLIPFSISNLSHLVDLSLDSNLFIGNIPSILGNLRNLATVSISNNNLTGPVPREIFGIPTIAQIALSFNNLNGKLPTEVGNAKRLIYLQLSSNKLSGDIPITLGNCESLEDIELDNNILSGNIPISLGNIRTLKILNLSYNNLAGSIPASLGSIQFLGQLDLSFNNLEGEVPVKGIFTNKTAMRIDGNQKLCGGMPELQLPACSVHHLDYKHNLSVVLKVVIPVAFMVSLTVLIYMLLLFWRRKHKTQSVSFPSFGREFPKVSYNDIIRATECFSTSNLIGQGRYGYVYQGKLFLDGQVLAIKVFNLERRGAQRSFMAECSALRDVRHRNIVPILTACSTIDSNGNDFKALVYKFMPRGDLHNLLYSTQDSVNSSDLKYISMIQRLNIVVDVSDALAYLHHNHQGMIVHCDMKPSNILLDDFMVAHIGDFGLAKYENDSASSFTDSNSISWAPVMGTIGYVAPECAQGGQVSTASDVYSFGVVLLEVFIRRRPTDDMFKDEMSIVNFTEINFPDNVLQIVDPQLLQELGLLKETPMTIKDTGAQILQSVLSVGLCCTKTSPSERMDMQEVAAKLHGIRDAYRRGK